MTGTALPASLPAPPAVRAVQPVLATFTSGYANQDWTAVRSVFSDAPLANHLVSQMKIWRSEQVAPLQATLVYRRELGNGRSIGTVRFASDPRAIAQYGIYVFSGTGASARIIGTTTGIPGHRFDHAAWSVSRFNHFTVYHSPYELQGIDRSAVASLDYERTQFERKFGVKVAAHMSYYWYPEQRMMAPMTYDTCGTTPGFIGCAQPYTEPPSIHTSEWPSYHEPIHIYELALEPPVKKSSRNTFVAPLFISEGTAVALEDREVDPRLSDYCSDLVYIPLDECARQAIPSVRPLSVLSDHGFQSAVAGDVYALGGSFVKYLILHYGYHRFGRYYYVLAAQPGDGLKDYNVAGRTVYHRSMPQLLSAWQAELCRAGC